jgi:hypothetical protein
MAIKKQVPILKKGILLRVTVKSDDMDIQRYFTQSNKLKAFLKWLKKNLKGGKVTFKQFIVN